MADCGALLMCYTHRYLCNLKNVADGDAKKKKEKERRGKRKDSKSTHNDRKKDSKSTELKEYINFFFSFSSGQKRWTY